MGGQVKRVKEYTEDIAEIPPHLIRIMKETLNFELVKNFESITLKAHYQQFFLRSPGFRENHKQGLQFLREKHKGGGKRFGGGEAIDL